MKVELLKKKSEELRKKTIKYRIDTNSAHAGSDLSCIEILTALYYEVMSEKDTFLLSKGHGSGALYSILEDIGKIPQEQYLKLSHHPDLNPRYGINATTGSLGHGLSIGVGMAFSDRLSKVYVLLGDGECDEGQVWEAADLACRLRIENLVGIVDCNGWQGFKRSECNKLEKKFRSFGWLTGACDGHNFYQLLKSLNAPGKKAAPFVLLAKTIKGKGLKEGLEGTLDSHYKIPKEI